MVPFAFVCLGLLVGVLSGLANSPIATALLAALFTFAGGSAVHLVERKPTERLLIASIVTSFAISCLVGLFGGVVVKENRLLTTSKRAAEERAAEAKGTTLPDYFKSAALTKANEINVLYADNRITADEAYRLLRQEFDRLAAKLP